MSTNFLTGGSADWTEIFGKGILFLRLLRLCRLRLFLDNSRSVGRRSLQTCPTWSLSAWGGCRCRSGSHGTRGGICHPRSPRSRRTICCRRSSLCGRKFKLAKCFRFNDSHSITFSYFRSYHINDRSAHSLYISLFFFGTALFHEFCRLKSAQI